MIKNNKKRIMEISATVSENELELMKAYILGAVHGFTAAADGKSFRVRDLFGAANRDWHKTPIQKIYEFYHSTLPHEEAAGRAGQDVGKLLRKVLTEDKYTYEEEEKEENGNRVCTYHRL